MTTRGPLAALAGLPGVRGAVVRAGAAALGSTVGLVLLAAGLAHAIARAAGPAGGGVLAPLTVAAAGAVLRALAGTLGERAAARDARRAEDELRRALLDRLAASPAAVAAAGGPAPAAVLTTTRLADLTPALATYLPALAQTLVVPPVLLVVLAATDLLSAGLVAVTLPLVPLFLALVGLATRDGTADAARALDRLAAHVAELVRGLPVLVGLGRAADQVAALAELGQATRRRTLATLRLAFLSALVLELIATLSVALVAVTVGLRLVHGELDLAVGLTALLLAPEAFAPLRALGTAHHAGEAATLAAAEARAVLATPTGAPVAGLGGGEPRGATVAAGNGDRPGGAGDGDDPRGAAVDVRGLTVRHPGRAVAALPPTDLVLEPGELVVLRGASGSGKSTLLAALTGGLEPTAVVAGTVTGVGPIALVPQHPRTTAPTVAGELRRHGAGSEAEVLDALDRVGAAALAGRTCGTLSPGELQRVAVARALVRVRHGARLLLLDEPTAHLDAAAAADVAAALTALRGTVTTLLVTHDATLTTLADRTITLPSRRTPPIPATPAIPAPPTTSAAAPHIAAAAVAVPEPARAAAAAGVGRPRLGWAVAAGTASAGAGVALTAVSGWLIVRAAEMPPILTLLVAIVGVRAFGLGRAALRWVERLTAHDAALRLTADLRVRVWRALAAQGVAADRTPGSALARVVGDVGLIQDLSVRVLPPAAIAATVPALTLAALALLSPAAAGTAAAVLAVTTALVLLVHRGVDLGAARAEGTLRVTALRDVTTVLDGATDLRAHGLAAATAAELAGVAGRRSAAAATAARAGALGTGLVGLGTGLAAVAATAVGIATGLGGPAVAVLGLAPLALAEPLGGLVSALQRRGALADARARLGAVLAAPVPADPADPLPAPAAVRGLAVMNLTAGWPGGPDVLHGLTARAASGRPDQPRRLTARPPGGSPDGPAVVRGLAARPAGGSPDGPAALGGLAAGAGGAGWLVVRGPSGAGKSTFLAVLLAGLRPRAGRYELGGIDTARLTGDAVRSRTAWLPQDAHVFASTIRANLALAAPRGGLAGPDGEARMTAALTAAGLGPLLAGLPDGLDTPVGAGGTGLSGGERRRLAVARALLADRDVVLLDEPTAHLDPPTAAALLRDLRAALAGRVVVCVTHDDTVEQPGDTVVRLAPADATHPPEARGERRPSSASAPAQAPENSSNRAAIR